MRFFKTFSIFSFFFFLVCLWGGPYACLADGLAAWVVRFDIDSRDKVARVCSQARQADFDRLLVQVRGRADAYYQSDLVPRAEGLEGDFDPLAEVLAACKGVEVDAWLNVYYLWTGDVPPRDRQHPAHRKEWLIRDLLGRRVDGYTALEQSQRWLEGLYADPASAAYRRYFRDLVVELVQRYPVRGIHLDFVRYPGPYFGGGTRLAHDFQQQYGVAVSDLPDQLSRQDFAAWLNNSLSTQENRLVTARLLWDTWRAAQVTELVSMVRTALNEVRPAIRLSASVFPDPLESFLGKGQDWPGWLAADLVDELFIMNYFGNKDRVQALFDEVLQVAGRTDKLWLGLGTYIKSPKEIGEEVALCRGGRQPTCFFSLGHFLRQHKAIGPYVDAVKKPLYQPVPVKERQQGSQLVQALTEVKRCLATSSDSGCELRHRFAGVTDDGLGDTCGSTAASRSWLQLRGIFRYVSPYDSLATVQEQLELALQSYHLLKEGRPFSQVAAQFSQAGSRHYGGKLLRHFLHDDNPADKILSRLEPGQISPVIPVHNGFWVYQVVAKGH